MTAGKLIDDVDKIMRSSLLRNVRSQIGRDGSRSVTTDPP